MVKITVALIIEKCFPTRVKSSISESEIDALRCINLSNSLIDEIDNLEVFSDIAELDLSHNRISALENLLYLSNLEELNVSNNNIKDLESLGLDFLPNSLKVLNISNNPCCKDESLILAIRSRLPSIRLICDYDIVAESTTVETEGESGTAELLKRSMAAVYADNEEGTNHLKEAWEDEDPTTAEEQLPEAEYEVVDADAVLKEIVDRKCHMQDMCQFDLDHTLTMLNAEAEAPRIRKSRVYALAAEELEAEGDDLPNYPKRRNRCAESKQQAYYDETVISEWKKSCLASNAREAAHDADFIDALKNRMKKNSTTVLMEYKGDKG